MRSGREIGSNHRSRMGRKEPVCFGSSVSPTSADALLPVMDSPPLVSTGPSRLRRKPTGAKEKLVAELAREPGADSLVVKLQRQAASLEKSQ
jgi:hypothetical protein